MLITTKKYKFGKVIKKSVSDRRGLVLPEADTLRKAIRMRRAQLESLRRELLTRHVAATENE